MLTRRHALLALSAASCARKPQDMNALAERYVKLILAIGHHDANYVDAYYGPPEWKSSQQPLDRLSTEASSLAIAIGGITGGDLSRQNYLLTQTQAAGSRIRLLRGEKFSFDKEAQMLYEAHPPGVSGAELEAGRETIDKALPGSGPLEDRYAKFDARFAIPAARVDRTFKAAIAEARTRTRKWIPDLPGGEAFDIEYVKDKSWSAYNWYKGGAHSLIQVNIELPINIDRILHLACHEGYPGHHVYNALLEARLVNQRGWVEYCVYPLYSPQSLIAEGTADYGANLVIHGEERLAFKRDVLFKEAGLDPTLAAEQHKVQQMLRALRHAPIQAARAYMDGAKSKEETLAYLQRYALQPKAMAERRVRFFDEHRTYIINYSFGEDIVANWVQRTAGQEPAARWKAFVEILSNPRTPANLL
ncbi:MAG: hypothetical protein HYX27_03160 [Acidobacteria bacterium]|nr:hypothetical protein [Acidobacteriota bacterium]